jgi:hypothetical protein
MVSRGFRVIAVKQLRYYMLYTPCTKILSDILEGCVWPKEKSS